MIRGLMAPMLAASLLVLARVPANALPGDIFGGDDRGIIPTDAPKGPIAKCETRVEKARTNLVKGFAKCHEKRAALKLATANDVETCESTAVTKFTTTKTTGCAACTDLSSIESWVELTLDENFFPSSIPTVFCAGTDPMDADDFTAHVPPDAPTGPIAKCEIKVSKAVSKLVRALSACHQKRAVEKLATAADEDTCESTALAKFASTDTTGCDPCTSLSTIAAAVKSDLDDFVVGTTYCAASTAPCDHANQSCTCTYGTEAALYCVPDIGDSTVFCAGGFTCAVGLCQTDGDCTQVGGFPPSRCVDGPALKQPSGYRCCVPDCSQPPVTTTTTLPCAGVRVGGFCWYLGLDGQSCAQVCSSSSYDQATATYAGSGGSDAHCTTVLNALGAPAGSLQSVAFCLSPGVGCNVNGGNRVRCINPPTDDSSSASGVARACACTL